MNAGKYIFSQLVSFLPKRVFDGIVKRHEGDKWVKHFTCWNQLLALMFGVLAFVLSFIPPGQIATGNNTVWYTVLIAGCIIMVIIPLIIYARRKPSWHDPNAEFAPFHND